MTGADAGGEGELVESVYLWEGPPRLELLRETVVPAVGAPWQHHRLVVQRGIPGVVIVAGDASRLLFVRHARPGVGDDRLELPRGFGDPGPGHPESDDDAACRNGTRELREETGHHALSARVLGRYVTDSALLPGTIAVVGIEVDLSRAPEPTDGETMSTVMVDRADVPRLVRCGAVADAHTLSGLALALIG